MFGLDSLCLRKISRCECTGIVCRVWYEAQLRGHGIVFASTPGHAQFWFYGSWLAIFFFFNATLMAVRRPHGQISEPRKNLVLDSVMTGGHTYRLTFEGEKKRILEEAQRNLHGGGGDEV